MNWNEIVDKATPHVVKIETPVGYGTGLLCFYNVPRNFCAIATASHVVSHANRWKEPIRIHHSSSKKFAFLKGEDRFIFDDPKRI